MARSSVESQVESVARMLEEMNSKWNSKFEALGRELAAVKDSRADGSDSVHSDNSSSDPGRVDAEPPNSDGGVGGGGSPNVTPGSDTLRAMCGDETTYPLRIKPPKERPPKFSGALLNSHEWVKSFREYAGFFGFLRILDAEDGLDVSNHNLSVSDAIRLGFSERILEDSRVARWALRASSTDRKFLQVVEEKGKVHEAWQALKEIFLPQSAARVQKLQESVLRAKLRDKEDPLDLLARLDDTCRGLFDLGVSIPESIILQSFLYALPEKYQLEKRMLAGEVFDRKGLVARIRGRFVASDSKSFLGEALVVKDQKDKKGKSNGKNAPKTDPSVVCWYCNEKGHVQSRCQAKKVCGVCGGRVHGEGQCETNGRVLAACDAKFFGGEAHELAGMTTVERRSAGNNGKANSVQGTSVDSRCDYYTVSDRSISSVADCLFAADNEEPGVEWKKFRRPDVGQSVTWIADTGATKHMCNSNRGMFDFVPSDDLVVRTASNELVRARGVGKLHLIFVSQDQPTAIFL